MQPREAGASNRPRRGWLAGVALSAAVHFAVLLAFVSASPPLPIYFPTDAPASVAVTLTRPPPPPSVARPPPPPGPAQASPAPAGSASATPVPTPPTPRPPARPRLALTPPPTVDALAVPAAPALVSAPAPAPAGLTQAQIAGAATAGSGPGGGDGAGPSGEGGAGPGPAAATSSAGSRAPFAPIRAWSPPPPAPRTPCPRHSVRCCLEWRLGAEPRRGGSRPGRPASGDLRRHRLCPARVSRPNPCAAWCCSRWPTAATLHAWRWDRVSGAGRISPACAEFRRRRFGYPQEDRQHGQRHHRDHRARHQCRPVRSISHWASQGVKPPKMAVAAVAPSARPVSRPSPGNCSAVATAPTALTPPATQASTTAPSSARPVRAAGHQREHGRRQAALASASDDQHRLPAPAVRQHPDQRRHQDHHHRRRPSTATATRVSPSPPVEVRKAGT